MQQKINTTELYDHSWSHMTPEHNLNGELKKQMQESSQSLIKFIESYLGQFRSIEWIKGKRVLELGCGLAGVSQYLATKALSVHAIDISPLAIINARELATPQFSNIEFFVDDVCTPKKSYGEYDLIVDSHLLHCLTNEMQRQKYFEFVKSHLASGGIFLCETMCENKQLQEPLGYNLESNHILWQEINHQEFPVRAILPSIKIENEIKNSGLELNYFYYHHELAFNVFPEYPTYPEFRLPRTIRLGAQLASA